jgi:hypothetical protein
VHRTRGAVLELGAGSYSTPLLHLLCGKRRLVTGDSDADWLGEFSSLRSNTHEFHHVVDWSAWSQIDGKWAVAFVDHWPEPRRPDDIRRLKNNCTFIVVHDANTVLHRDNPDLLSEFRHVHTYDFLEPWTAVLSMRQKFSP